jgi:metal-sulfur cluster biosynthetic enzyme
MTLTSPACPAAQSMPKELSGGISKIENVKKINVHVVWEPRWDWNMMSEAARLELGFI